MTATLPATEVAAGVTAWLADFGDALAAGDPAAAAGLFAEDCYWRDLIAFTWNIKTLEGRDEIAGDARAGRCRGCSRAAGGHRRRGAGRGGRRDRGVDRFRDRRRAAATGTCGCGRPVLDAADHLVRAQGA